MIDMWIECYQDNNVRLTNCKNDVMVRTVQYEDNAQVNNRSRVTKVKAIWFRLGKLQGLG